MRKSFLVSVIFITLAVTFLSAQTTENPALKPIINNFGARNYATGNVTDAELQLIIQAGIRAPSAGNRQPWHFTVVQNQAMATRVLGSQSPITDGNVLIVVSATGNNRTNSDIILDCALAVQSMYLAAQALGLGSRIYTGPVNNINQNLKTDLGLDNNYNVMAVVRIGRLPANVDAVSSASTRNSADRTVNYK
jgi:nitroreductase